MKSETNSKPDKNELINLLDSEIEFNKADQYRNGVTIWALIVGIASLIWMILDIAEKATYFVNRDILMWVLLFSTFTLSIRYLVALLSPKSNLIALQVTESLFSNHRQTILASFIIQLAFIKIIILIKPYIPTISYYPILIFYILHLTTNFLVFITSFWNLPIIVSPRNKNNWVIGSFLILLSIPSIMGLSTYLFTKSIIIIDLRMSLLYFSVLVLIYLTMHNSKDSPDINRMIILKRELILNKIQAEIAMKEFEKIFSLSVSDILEKELKIMQEKAQTVEENAIGMLEKLKRASENLPNPEQLELIQSLVDKGILTDIIYENDTLIESCHEDIKYQHKILVEISKKTKDMKKKVSFLKRLTKDTGFYDELLDILDARLSWNDKLQSQSVTVFNAISEYANKYRLLKKNCLEFINSGKK